MICVVFIGLTVPAVGSACLYLLSLYLFLLLFWQFYLHAKGKSSIRWEWICRPRMGFCTEERRSFRLYSFFFDFLLFSLSLFFPSLSSFSFSPSSPSFPLLFCLLLPSFLPGRLMPRNRKWECRDFVHPKRGNKYIVTSSIRRPHPRGDRIVRVEKALPTILGKPGATGGG